MSADLSNSAAGDRASVSTNQRKRKIGQNGIVTSHNERNSIRTAQLDRSSRVMQIDCASLKEIPSCVIPFAVHDRLWRR